MIHGKNTKGRMLRYAGFAFLAAVVFVCGSAGCSNWNLRGDGFSDKSGSESIRSARKGGKTPEFWGFSNKAKEINDDFAD
jgi:hypothetical protein